MNRISVTIPKLKAESSTAFPTQWDQPDSGFSSPSLNSFTEVSVGLGAPFALVYQETIDLSAFVVQDKSFFPLDIQIAEPGIAKCQPAPLWNDAAALQIVDLISATPLDIDVVANEIVGETYYGFPSSPNDNQFLMFGRYMAFTNSTTTSFEGLMELAKTSTFGAGLPTAADKLYAYRFVIPEAGTIAQINPGAILDLFPTRYTIIGEAREESELARIYRLRQSYEQRLPTV